MLTILVIVLLIILLGGGGGYYAHGQYGRRRVGRSARPRAPGLARPLAARSVLERYRSRPSLGGGASWRVVGDLLDEVLTSRP
jgi:hypothetical protein